MSNHMGSSSSSPSSPLSYQLDAGRHMRNPLVGVYTGVASSDYQHIMTPVATIVRNHVRKGKWTLEEKEYTQRIMDAFRDGTLKFYFLIIFIFFSSLFSSSFTILNIVFSYVLTPFDICLNNNKNIFLTFF